MPKKMSRRPPLAVLCLAAAGLLPPLPALATAPAPTPTPAPAVTDRKALEELDGQLERREWTAAEAAARGRVDQALHGKASLAEAVARLALAEAGLDRLEDALWHWAIARALGTAFDPAPFGAPGARLAESPGRSWDEAPAGLVVRRAEDGGGPLSPVSLTMGKNPAVASEWRSYPKAIRVQVVVDAQGRPLSPVVAASTFPALTWAVLETLRSSSFTAARSSGQPVAAFFELALPPERKPLAQLVSFKGSPLAEAEALLRAGQLTDAGKSAQKVWRSSLDTADQPRSFLGVTLALRALAETAGDPDGAICRWQAAQTLEPRLYGADLAAYGGAGALLAAHPWGESLRVGTPGASGGEPVDGAGFLPPEVLKRRHPEYPSFARDLGAGGKLVVEHAILATGVPRNPVLTTDVTSPGLAATALDALCDWRFKPATFQGKPVPVDATLTFDFGIERRDWSVPRGGSTAH